MGCNNAETVTSINLFVNDLVASKATCQPRITPWYQVVVQNAP